MIWIILIVLGAALIAGGIVAYRGSRRTGVRAFSAAGIAAGVVMWAIVIITIPASSSDNKSPSPTVNVVSAITEERFTTLLAEGDVQGVLTTEVPVTAQFYDYKEMAAVSDPSQVENMDSFYGLSFQTEDGAKGVTFSAIDFTSTAAARDHYEQIKSETPGMQAMSPPISDASANVDVNAEGIGSVLIFVKGDKALSFHTARPDGQQSLMSLERLETLAKLVASRL